MDGLKIKILADNSFNFYYDNISRKFNIFIESCKNSGNIIEVYYKTNTITKDNFTVKLYNNLIVGEKSYYINDDTGLNDNTSYKYSDGSVSEINKYFSIRNDYKVYTIEKNDKGYSVIEED